MRDTLEVLGAPLFAGGLLTEHLEEQMRAQVLCEHAGLIAVRRQVTRLQLRRRFAAARFGGAVTITPEPTIVGIGELSDGRSAARHLSQITGDPAFLAYAPLRAMAEQRPVGTVEGNRLIITVAFAEADRSFVPALVQLELELIASLLAAQREVLERFNTGLPEQVRRLVAQEWPQLGG